MHNSSPSTKIVNLDYPEQVLYEYQLEIRRGSGWYQDDETIAHQTRPACQSIRSPNTTFDTNDRMVRETAVVSHELGTLGVVDGVVN